VNCSHQAIPPRQAIELLKEVKAHYQFHDRVESTERAARFAPTVRG